MSRSVSRLAGWIAALALLGCASQPPPQPAPQRYTGTLRQWFEGQSFTPDGQTEAWFYGINEDAARKLAAAFPEGYLPPPMGVAIRAEIMGVVTRVSGEARYASPLTAPWDHYITITDVISARVIPVGCETVDLTVYFDSNSAELTSTARTQIEHALGRLRRELCNVAGIEVTGYADTQGAAQPNQALSERRAASVAALVEMQGFAGDLIRSQGRGETELARPTGDNVAEPLNRNVRVVIESPHPN